jgi:hypothetical protein
MCLLLVFFASIGWIVFGWPLPFRLWFALALLAGLSATFFIGLFVKKDLPIQWKRALAVGSAIIVGIATIMAVPALQATEPLSASMKFHTITACEDFTASKSLVPLLSTEETSTGFDAKWMYEHGAATLNQLELTLQGNTEDAVVIKALRVIDVERHRPPADAVGILSCGPAGGGMTIKHFDVKMGKHPKVVSGPPTVSPDGEKSVNVRLPIKVSNNDPEIFVLRVTGPKCFCEWRLAIDWTTRGRSGTTIVDHGFGKIKSDTSDYKRRQLYYVFQGKWEHD